MSYTMNNGKYVLIPRMIALTPVGQLSEERMMNLKE
jgi:hypothetical protein